MIVFLFSICITGCAGQTEELRTTLPGATAPGAIIATNAKLLDTGSPVLPQVGEVAPDFQFTMPDGTTQKLSDLHGKKVVLNFWATWCEPCREEMPDLDKAYQKYADDVVVLAVNKAEKVERIAKFNGEVPVGFTLIADPQGDVSTRYFTVNVPLTFFINTDGTIGSRELKVMTYTTIERNITALR